MKSVTLDEVVEVLYGYAFDSERFGDEGDLPLVRIRDVVRGSSNTYYSGEYDPRYIIDDGDLLIGMDGEFNRERWSGGKALLNQRVCRIKALDPRLDESYLYWFLPEALREIERQTPFVTVKHLSAKQIKAITLPLPPIEEQRRIASILDAADALRAKRRQALETLDSLTQSIFIDMFGDPLTNPKRWPVEPFSAQIFDVRYGTGSPPPYVLHGGVPFVRATDIKNGRIRMEGMKHIAATDADALKKCRLQAGDLIIVRSGVNTGDVAVVPEHLDGACGAYDMIVTLAPHDAHFYHFILDSELGRRIVDPLTRRAAQPHLNASQVRDLPLIAPPVAERKRFVAILAKVDKSRVQMEEQCDRLDALFASLQHRAFRGEL